MPSNKPALTVLPPLGGVNRKTGFQTTAPFSSYDSINFWPIDPITGRAISATRPPLVAATSPAVDETVNMLERVNGVASGKPLQSMVCASAGDLYWWTGSAWTAATGAQAGSVPTGHAVYASTLLQKVYIPQTDAKPIVFDYTTGAAATMVETDGTSPTDCRMMITWKGALWQAGRLAAPHILYGSRIGDGLDWDFAAAITDTAGAFFTGGEREGVLRGPITALFAHNADTMIVSTTEGLVAFRGHPRQGGIIEDISSSAYIMGQGAWTQGPNGTSYFLTRLGMMSLGPEPGAVPAVISTNKLPDELVGLEYDYEDPVISMAYDSRWNGIHITVRGDEQQAWWYDLTAGGFHRMVFSSYPYVLMEFSPLVTSNKSGVLFAGADGISQMDRLGSESFTAELTFAPVKISPNASKAANIARAVVTYGGDTPTADGTLSVAVGVDGEDAIDRMIRHAAQYEVGLDALNKANGVCRPLLSGHAASFKFAITGGRCAIEQITLSLTAKGLNRMTRFRTILNSLKAACTGYVTATPQVTPTTDIADGLEIIDMARFPSDWWDDATDSGGNIRVSDARNNFLPFDLIGYLRTNSASTRIDEGCIVVRRPLPAAAEALRVWVCDESLAKFPAGSLFGQHNVYPPWMIGFWPGGYGDNRLGLAWPLAPAAGFDDDEQEIEYANMFSTNHPGLDTLGIGQPEEPLSVDLLFVGAAVSPNFSPGEFFGRNELYFGLEATDVSTPSLGAAGTENNPSIVLTVENAEEAGQNFEIYARNLDAAVGSASSVTIDGLSGFNNHLLAVDRALGKATLTVNGEAAGSRTIPNAKYDHITFSGAPPSFDADLIDSFNPFFDDGPFYPNVFGGFIATAEPDPRFLEMYHRGSSSATTAQATYWGTWTFNSATETVG